MRYKQPAQMLQTSISLSCFLIISVAAVEAQPVILSNGVVNAASNAPGGLPNSGIAQGSIFLVNGTGLGADNPTPMNLFQSTAFPLPSSAGLNGTTVQLNVGGRSVSAILLYESATQVAAILPSSTPTGQGSVTVSYNGQSSAAAAIQVVQRGLGIFTLNQAGNVAYVFNESANAAPVVNRVTHAAQSGQTIGLLGTGLGPIAGDETQTTYPGNLQPQVALQVYVGGKAAQVLPNSNYVGRVSGVAGVDEIDFEVPPGIQGCYVPITIILSGVVSNTATMSIGQGDICTEQSIGLTSADLQQFVSSNAARVGTVTLTRLNATFGAGGQTQQGQFDSAAGTFLNMTPQQFVGAPSQFPSPGACMVSTINAAAPPPPAAGTPMDAGLALNVNGPTGGQSIAQSADGSGYAAQFGSGYLEPGSFAVDDGGGGNDVGAFQSAVNTPAPFTWTIQNPGAAVPKTVPYIFTWRGGDPNSLVVIQGVSADLNAGVTAQFICAERNSVGNFTVPTYILSWMPVNSIPSGIFAVSDVTQSRFSAPGLDAGFLNYQIGYAINVQFTATTNSKI